jgi:hypothetical protein
MPLANPLHSPAGIFSGCRGKGPTRLDFGKAGIGNQSLHQVEGGYQLGAGLLLVLYGVADLS